MAELRWGDTPSSLAGSRAVTVDGTIYANNTALAFVSFNTNSSASAVSVSHSTQGALTRVGTFQTGNGSLDVFTIQDMVAGDVTATWSGGGITSQLTVIAVEDGTGITADSQATGSATNPTIAAVGSSGDRVIGFVCARFPDYAAAVVEGTAITGAQEFAGSLTVNATADDYSATLDHAFDVGATAKSYCIRSIAVGTSSVSVTQTDTTPEDGVQQTLTTSGLTGTPTGTLAGKALTLSGTLPNLTYTLDVSAVGASEGMPRIGETSTVAITGNEGTATTDVVIQPKTGWTRTVLAGTLDKSANGFLATLDADLGIASAVGDIIYFDASNAAAITATGVYSSNLTSAGQKTDFVIQQGGSATTAATSQGGSFYPYGEAESTSNNKRKRQKRVIRNYFYYGDRFIKGNDI